MAANFFWLERYGAAPGSTVDPTSYVHLLSSDVASGNSTNYTNYPITVPPSGSNYSYERFVRGKWTGTFNNIQNVKFWKSAGTPGTGWTLNAGATTTYVSPVNTSSGIASSAIPTSQGAGLTLTFDGTYSAFAVVQAVVASTAGPGDCISSPGATFSLSYDES